jgi:hypothetical protein
MTEFSLCAWFGVLIQIGSAAVSHGVQALLVDENDDNVLHAPHRRLAVFTRACAAHFGR